MEMFGRSEKHLKGYFIISEGINGDVKYKCSACGAVFNGARAVRNAKYCPSCRAKTVGIKHGYSVLEEMWDLDKY